MKTSKVSKSPDCMLQFELEMDYACAKCGIVIVAKNRRLCASCAKIQVLVAAGSKAALPPRAQTHPRRYNQETCKKSMMCSVEGHKLYTLARHDIYELFAIQRYWVQWTDVRMILV